MKELPLWELSKKTLSDLQNANEFSNFLKVNKRKISDQRLINPSQFHLRLAVLISILQLQLMNASWHLVCYYILKLLYIFSIDAKRIKLEDLIILFILYLIFPVTFSYLPFNFFIFWPVGLLYFLGGISERYLVLQILLLDSFLPINYLVLIILGLGKIRQNNGSKISKTFLLTDILIFGYLGKFQQVIILVALLCLIRLICFLDQQMLHQKRQYSHLFQIEKIQEYH